MLSGKPKIQIVESKHSMASVLTVALGVLGVLGELLVGVRLRSDARDRNGDDIADRTPERGTKSFANFAQNMISFQVPF